MKSIDVRKISFKKWVLPKTDKISSIENNIVIGYFDFLHIEQIELGSSKNPLEAYAESLKSHREQSMDEKNTTCQHILAFTNLSMDLVDKKDSDFKDYQSDKLNEFWEQTCSLTYVSLLHVKNGACLTAVVQKVNNIFNGQYEGYCAVCYFSLDYSDIIICAKNISLEEYIRKICLINYNNNEKLIRDAFSIVSIEKELIQLSFPEIQKYRTLPYAVVREKILAVLKERYNEEILNSKFTAAFNFGIQNFNIFIPLYNELKKHNVPFCLYKLFGRHDFSFYYEEIDIFWLIYMQYYIDEFSTKDNIKDKDEILFNCESFIKIRYEDNEIYIDELLKNKRIEAKEEVLLDDYQKAKKILELLINKYIIQEKRKEEEKTGKKESYLYNNQLYLKPIIAIGNCILSLLKNEFAEEFVLCFFEAFCMFLRYITKRIEKKNSIEFYQCFNEYFDNLNSLINSAMHNERQFIQYPSFNAVFYDIPTKLMAYYTASTRVIMDIIKTKEDKKYSLIFRPGFWQDVSIVPYSFNELPPVDRLLSVYINEQALYHPNSLMRIMCHEVAHYVGDSNRQRPIRKEVWLKNMLYSFFHAFLQNNLSIYVDDIDDKEVRRCIEKLMADIIEKENFYKQSEGYAVEFRNLIFRTIYSIVENQKAKSIIVEAFSKCYKKKQKFEFSSEEDFRKFSIYLMRIKDYFGIEYNKNAISMKKYIIDTYDNMEYIFSETYADLQMVLILGLSLEEYINEFLINEELAVDDIRNKRANLYYRIFNIVVLFHKIGKWNVDTVHTTNNEIHHFVQYLRTDIQDLEMEEQQYKNIFNKYKILQPEQKENNMETSDFIKQEEDLGELSSLNNYWNDNVQKYLIKVLESSCKEYDNTDKIEKIQTLRLNCEKINDYNDVIEVLDCVYDVNRTYAKKLYDIEYWENMEKEIV